MRSPKYDYEKPSSGHRLRIFGHVFPKASIDRFADPDRVVWLRDLLRSTTRRVRSNDKIFCARRAWDHRTEARYMKTIEDQFQALAEDIITNSQKAISIAAKEVINEFYALWCMRATH